MASTLILEMIRYFCLIEAKDLEGRVFHLDRREPQPGKLLALSLPLLNPEVDPSTCGGKSFARMQKILIGLFSSFS